ncbi:hypothetical protein VTH06DRAFT_5822 [Thermothelomyces fergusii]
MMTTSTTGRLVGLVAILALLQPALASFYTITEYYLIVETVTSYDEYSYTRTSYRTVNPTVTPTADAVSTSTSTDRYDDVEIVSVFLTDGVDERDLVPTSPTDDNLYTFFAVKVTWTAPSSCPTPFTVVTDAYVNIPWDVRPYMEAESTATSVFTDSEDGAYTYVTKYVDQSAVVPSRRPVPTSDFHYTYYVENCRNPTATNPSEFYGPTYTRGSGGYRGGDDDDDDEDDDDGGRGHSSSNSRWCSAYHPDCGVAAWVIAVATVIPAIFLLGFVESYFWFRRMMLGKPALRLGTVCWCCLSLWFVLLTRRSPGRSPQDQALLWQYWDTLGAGTRVRLWLKHGFRWRYPAELIGNPDGNNPVVPPTFGPPPLPPPPPAWGRAGMGPADADGSEKPPYQHQQQPYYVVQPFPGQAYYPPPGPPLPPHHAQGYGMAMPVPQQQSRPQEQQQQQLASPYTVPEGVAELPPQQPTGTAGPGTGQQPQAFL